MDKQQVSYRCIRYKGKFQPFKLLWIEPTGQTGTQQNIILGQHRDSGKTTFEDPLINDGVYMEGYIENVRILFTADTGATRTIIFQIEF